MEKKKPNRCMRNPLNSSYFSSDRVYRWFGSHSTLQWCIDTETNWRLYTIHRRNSTFVSLSKSFTNYAHIDESYQSDEQPKSFIFIDFIHTHHFVSIMHCLTFCSYVSQLTAFKWVLLLLITLTNYHCTVSTPDLQAVPHSSEPYKKQTHKF